MENRVRLTNGATINDVYDRLVDCAECDGMIDKAELRSVIHDAGLLYEECSRLTVSLNWVQGHSSEPEPLIDELIE